MNCEACGAEEGELHRYFWCMWEICPFCRGMVIQCDCIYDRTDLRNKDKYLEKFDFLSRKVYMEGPPQRYVVAFKALMLACGRIPFSPNDIPEPRRSPTSES